MITNIVELHQREFALLSSFIYRNYGIKMPETKKPMLKARLQSRLRANGMRSFRDYCDFVFSTNNETEIMHMIDVVSTNKTDFFREMAHFTFLENEILPGFFPANASRTFKIWSAACSSGEEVYTISIVLNEFMEKHGKFEYQVHGSDISFRMLERAKKAIYHEERVRGMPYHMKRKYLLRSIDKEKEEVRVVRQLRSKTSFSRINLMHANYEMPKDFDIIFCRNVLIYFDKHTQEKVINQLCEHLKPGAYLFLGHSESVNGLDVPLESVKPTIYRRV